VVGEVGHQYFRLSLASSWAGSISTTGRLDVMILLVITCVCAASDKINYHTHTYLSHTHLLMLEIRSEFIVFAPCNALCSESWVKTKWVWPSIIIPYSAKPTNFACHTPEAMSTAKWYTALTHPGSMTTHKDGEPFN
jgi:hypothetical protein